MVEFQEEPSRGPLIRPQTPLHPCFCPRDTCGYEVESDEGPGRLWS